MLHTIGEKAQELFETFDLTEENAAIYEQVTAAFEQYCVLKKNEIVCRHLFFQRNQKEGETFDEFLTELKRLSLDCAFDVLKDSLIKDRIISGIKNTNIKYRLL